MNLLIKNISLIICLFILQNTAFSQSAINEYNKALKEFKDGNTNACLLYLATAQTYLDGSNAKIESLKCFALVAKSDWINAAITYTNYERLLPSSAKYGEAYSAMLDLRKEIWNELENIEKKKKEKLENEIKEDLAIAKEQEKTQEVSTNSKKNKINESNEKELYEIAMQTKDIELLSIYKSEIKDSGTNLKIITTEIDKQKNPTSFLLSSIKNDDLQDFKYIISLGADLKWTNPKGESLLHLAIVHDAYKIYDELIKLNADVEQRDQDGNTPLIKAVINNKITFFKQLLKNNASLTATNSLTKQAPFYYSLLDSNVVIGEIIIKNGINPNDYLVINNKNFTPLYLSVFKTKSIEYATFLIRNGAEIDKVSGGGETPLMGAVENNSLAFVNFLLNNGANVNLQDEYKQTALHLAVRKENPEMVLYLIQRGGADKKIKDIKEINPRKLSEKLKNDNITRIIKTNRRLINPSSDYHKHDEQYLLGIEKLKKKVNNASFFNIGYQGGTIGKYGIVWEGGESDKRFGFRMSFRGSFISGETSKDGDYNYVALNDTKEGRFSIDLGPTIKIAYPFYLYAGIGLGEYRKWVLYDIQNKNSGSHIGKEYCSFDDSSIFFETSLGALIRLGRVININGGLSFKN